MRILHWFRKDLRLDDNPALSEAAHVAQHDVVPFYASDPAWFEQPHMAATRVRFVLGALTELSAAIAARGSRLALAHGDPHMDLPPVLMALAAQVTATGPSGSRTIAMTDLYTGYYETALASNELITEVGIPAQDGRRSAYIKCTTRTADDWPTLGIAVSLVMAGDTVEDARVVVSAATEKPLRLAGAEAVLHGATVNDALLARVGEAAAAEAEMVGDARGSAAYKKELLRVYAGRAVRKALGSQP